MAEAITRLQAATPACSLVVHNTDCDNVFYPTDDKKIIVTVQNASADAKSTELSMQGITDDGKPVKFNQHVDVAPHAKVDVPVTLDLREPCFADCTFSLGQDAKSVRMTFAVVRPPDLQTIAFDTSCFGACNIEHPKTAKKIGVRFLRSGIFWKWSNRKPGEFNFHHYTDWFQQFEEAGIPVICTMEPNYPDWVKVSHMIDLGQPEPLKFYSQWVSAAMKAMPPGPKAMEFNNEPDISLGRHGDVAVGIATTATLLKTGYDIVKAFDPSIPVLGVDVSSGGPRDRDFATRALQLADGKIDEFSVHLYSEQHYIKPDGSVVWPDEYMTQMLEPNIKLADQYTQKKGIWSTEMGWAYPWQEVYLSDAARNFAKIVAQTLVMVKTVPHFEKMTWFRGSTGFGTNERGYDYSLLTKGFMGEEGCQPTPGANAFATVASLLEGCDVGQPLKLGPALHGYIFANKESRKAIAAVWSVQYDVSLHTPTPPACSIFDIYGRQRTVAPGGKWTVDRGPSFFVVNLNQLDPLKSFLTTADWKPDQPLVVSSVGATSTKLLDLKVSNFLNSDAKVDISLPGGVTRATLHSGDNIISAPLPAKAFDTAHLQFPVKITSSAGDTNYNVDRQLVAAVYAAPGTYSPDGILSPQKLSLAAASLRDRDNIFPTDPTVPWKGPDDLSLKFGYAWNEQGLYILVIAHDDTLIAIPDADNNFWVYDALQLACGPSGNRVGTGYQTGDHELGLVLTASGKSKLFQSFPPAKPPSVLQYHVARTGQDTIYEMILPWDYILSHPQPPANAVFALNFIVNDNDGTGRKCWMGLYDGIADGKRPAFFPWVHLLPKPAH
jgi:hypothetical protein